MKAVWLTTWCNQMCTVFYTQHIQAPNGILSCHYIDAHITTSIVDGYTCSLSHDSRVAQCKHTLTCCPSLKLLRSTMVGARNCHMSSQNSPLVLVIGD